AASLFTGSLAKHISRKISINLIKDDLISMASTPPAPTPIPLTSSFDNLQVVKFAHKWTLNNFSFRDFSNLSSIKFPPISPDSNCSAIVPHQFYIELHPESFTQWTIFLCTTKKADINVRYEVSILGATGQKRNTKRE